MKKSIKYSLIAVITLAAILLCAGYYMLGYALKPEGLVTRSRNTQTSLEYMQETYPEVGRWIDSLQTAGALHDLYIENDEGTRLHALYIQAADSTDRTAVIVHGYTDNSIRMLMIGYLYNRKLGYNILLPDLYGHGLSGGAEAQMGWKDRLDVLLWTDEANRLLGGNTQMVVHGISMCAATTMCVSGEVQHGLGRIQGRAEEPVRPACLPVAPCGQCLVQHGVRLELPGGLAAGAGKEMHPAHALHPWRCRYLRTYLDGLSAIRSQARAQGTLDSARCRTCRGLQGKSRNLYPQSEQLCRKIHSLNTLPDS